MDRKQIIINILATERAEYEAAMRKAGVCLKGEKVFKYGINNRVRIRGPVSHGDTTVRVSSDARILCTTKRRVLPKIDEVFQVS